MCGCRQPEAITQDELVRRAQELMDSVASGTKGPWEKYFAADCLFFDEKGRNMDKKALLADLQPLPSGYSGTIRVVNPQSLILADTAILSYDMNESETIFGQTVTARYHETDTWMLRNGTWQIVAGQVLRYYEDPAPGRAYPAKYKNYAGDYELAPGKTLAISIEENRLYSQKAGQKKIELIPEAPDLFFKKGQEGRQLFRRDESGKVDALIDRRNNEDLLWKKRK
jgi:hypothetical protein